jgi:hypothetical protein
MFLPHANEGGGSVEIVLLRLSTSMRTPSPFKFMPLPEGFNPIDATVDEVRAFRRESRWSVFEKLRTGVYQSYLDGRVRKIIFASVIADRERSMADGRDKQCGNALRASAARAAAKSSPVKKRRPGRPRKPATATVAAE